MTQHTQREALARCSWPGLSTRHETALRAVVGFIFKRFEPTALVAAGSIVRGVADRASDLDIWVLHDAPFKQRVQRWFGDVPAEIFVNTPGSTREYFEPEHHAGRPSAAHMLVTGRVLIDSEALAGLRAEATAWLARPTVLTPEEHTLRRYRAAGLLEDAADIVERDGAMASGLMTEAVLATLRYWVLVQNGVAAPSKRLLADVERIDPELAALAHRFFAVSQVHERLSTAHAIADRAIQARGFFEWESEPVTIAAAAQDRATDRPLPSDAEG